MTREIYFPPERELLGLTTLEFGRLVVLRNPEIAKVNLRAYFYIPDTPSADEPVLTLDREDFLSGDKAEKFLAFVKSWNEGWNVALDSLVALDDGQVGYLAMVDISALKSPESLEKVKRRFGEIVAPRFGGGAILETNWSYQFFGTEVLTFSSWLQFLGASLITSIVTIPEGGGEYKHELIADYRYIGHSLMRGSTGLRITNWGRKTFEPKVVALV